MENQQNNNKRLEIERFKIENELAIKREKLELYKKSLEKEPAKKFFSPILATILAAIIGLLGTTIGVFLQGRTNTQLERNKFEFALISKAFETKDQNAASSYLKFVLESGIIEDLNLRTKIDSFIKKPKTIPKLQSYISLEFDLLNGNINGLPPTASQSEVKSLFPFSTGDTPDGSNFNYGGGVFFTNYDFYYYTHLKYIEVRGNFSGNMSPSILHEPREVVLKNLGSPDKVDNSEQTTYYNTKYGCLRIEFENNKVSEIGVHYTKIDSVIKYRLRY